MNRNLKLGLFLVAWSALVVSGNFIPRLEGYFNPVVSSADITSEFLSDPLRLKLNGKMTVKRDCEFEGFEWYIRSGLEEHHVKFTKDDTRVLLSGDVIKFGPIELTIAEATVLFSPESEFLIYHTCHNGWKTITKVEPS